MKMHSLNIIAVVTVLLVANWYTVSAHGDYCSECECYNTISDSQKAAIEEYQASFENVSSEVIEEIVYNITTPLVNLTEAQEDKLLEQFPSFFTTSSERKRRATTPRVCDTTGGQTNLYSALEFNNRWRGVVIPQSVRVVQLFDEEKCISDTCSGGVDCSCVTEFRSVTAIIASADINAFVIDTILLHACVAVAAP